MTLTNLSKSPFPYFGGSRHAAPLVWEALGDPTHYVDPFMGSLAVPLLRPHPANRTYHSETVNDAHGLLCNAWRAIAYSPDATAEAASWPVCEADVMARQLAILDWARAGNLERLMADPRYHDPIIGGMWIWGVSCWIGSGFATGDGPWVVGADGRVTRRPRGGGACRKRPHLSDDGQGVNHAGAREPGVARQLPHLSDDGQGVNRPQAREPGVARQLPHLSNNGRGVNHAGGREPGVAEDDGLEFHPMTMPEVRRWFQFLSARLRHVRIVNGDWRRIVTGGALQTLKVRQGRGGGNDVAGIFFDPPYANGERAAGLYAHDDGDVAADVRAWCAANGDNPRYRIVLKGFAGEGHEALEPLGWRCVSWFTEGYLRGGYRGADDEHQMHRERLWLSPHCLVTSAERGEELPPLLALLDELEAA